MLSLTTRRNHPRLNVTFSLSLCTEVPLATSYVDCPAFQRQDFFLDIKELQTILQCKFSLMPNSCWLTFSVVFNIWTLFSTWKLPAALTFSVTFNAWMLFSTSKLPTTLWTSFPWQQWVVDWLLCNLQCLNVTLVFQANENGPKSQFLFPSQFFTHLPVNFNAWILSITSRWLTTTP